MMKPRLLVLVLFLWPFSLALAQSGKIAGTVTDAATGTPLPGVNVVLDGTTIGATTDVDGYYAILNVRPGTYAVRASFVGYAPAVVEGVEVDIGLTTNLDFALQEEAVGMEEVVVTAQAPIIQRDIAGSQSNISGEDIARAPFKSVSNILTSAVSINDVSNSNDRPEIRGSSFDEALFIVDGVNQGDALNHQPHFQINLDAVEEIKVETGAFSAEYGNVRSGIVNVVTKEGGDRYSGSANIQYSPPALKHFGPNPFGHGSPLSQPFVNPEAGAFTGNDIFNGWNAIADELAESGEPHGGQPMELYARWLWRHRSQDSVDELKRLEQQGVVQFAEGVDPDDMVYHQTGVRPDYRMSFTFGGPVPLVRPVNFFVSYDEFEQEYAYRFPEPTYNDRNVRAKLTTSLAPGLKLNAHGYWSRQTGGDGGQGPGIGGFVSSNPFTSTGSENKYWYPNCAVPGSRLRQIYGLQLTHALSPNTFYQINVTHDRVDYDMEKQMRNTAPIPGSGDPNDPASWIRSSSKTSGSLVDGGRIGTESEAEARAAAGLQGWANWRDWAMIKIGEHWYDEAPKGYGPVNWRDITGEYRMESCNLRADRTNSRGWHLDGAITSQVNQHNQVRAGFMVRQDKYDMYYEAIDPSVNGGSVFDSKVDPWHGAFWAEDKIEYEGFVANLGLRADWLTTGAFPAVLDGCDLENASACTGDTGPYSRHLLSGNTTVDAENGRVLGIKETVVTENLGTERYTQVRLSPRVGISHPISTVAKIFFNYGHFYQWPTAMQQYILEMDTPRGYTVENLGNPLLEPERTIQYEVGYEQNLFDRALLRLTGYYKDINNEIDEIEMHPLNGRAYDTYQNMEFRDVRGFEAFAELQRGVIPYVSGWVSANYLVESGAEYGYEEFFEDPSRTPDLAGTQVSNPDVRPILRSSISLHTPTDFVGPALGDVSLLGGIDVSLLYFWQRGNQFTWNPAEIPLVEDNVRWKPYQRWDLRVTKNLFQRGTFSSVLYLDVTNLFNHRNMTQFNGSNADSQDRSWAWDGHRWWKNQTRKYMESMGYTAENQNRDGSFDSTSGRPGDYGGSIDMPEFTPWTFLNARDIYFGVKVYF